MGSCSVQGNWLIDAFAWSIHIRCACAAHYLHGLELVVHEPSLQTTYSFVLLACRAVGRSHDLSCLSHSVLDTNCFVLIANHCICLCMHKQVVWRCSGTHTFWCACFLWLGPLYVTHYYKSTGVCVRLGEVWHVYTSGTVQVTPAGSVQLSLRHVAQPTKIMRLVTRTLHERDCFLQ